jgi:hypothetical protein
MSNIRTISVSAGVVEAWTTGDADVLDSEMMKVLNEAQEDVSRKGGKSAQVIVTIESGSTKA